MEANTISIINKKKTEKKEESIDYHFREQQHAEEHAMRDPTDAVLLAYDDR